MVTGGAKFTILDSVESTNNYAMAQAHSELSTHGQAWFALEQTAGKGRRNKNWESEKGNNIILSIAANTSAIPIYRQFEVSMAAAIACAQMASTYLNISVKIKWPNDIYINDKKAGGILIENILKGSVWQWSIIGIGFNVNQSSFPEQLNNATSLYQITGKKTDVIEAAKTLQHLVLERLDDVINYGADQLLIQYNLLLYKRNETVRLRKGNITFETMIKGVNADGELLTKDVIERKFQFDEIEWIFN